MLAAGFLIVFAGYTVGSWGVCLLKGYDITFVEWVDPLHPFQWSTVTQIPDNLIMPGGSVKGTPPATGSGSPSLGANTVNTANPVQSQIPQPGVQGTVAGGHGR